MTKKSADIIILPFVRVERFDEDTIGSAYERMRKAKGPRKPRNTQRRGANAMRKALSALERDANTAEVCIRWLAGIMRKDHDARALAALIEHWGEESIAAQWNPLWSRDECEAFAVFISGFMREFSKRFPPKPPRLVRTDEANLAAPFEPPSTKDRPF